MPEAGSVHRLLLQTRAVGTWGVRWGKQPGLGHPPLSQPSLVSPSPADTEPSPGTTNSEGGEAEHCPRRATHFGVPLAQPRTPRRCSSQEHQPWQKFSHGSAQLLQQIPAWGIPSCCATPASPQTGLSARLGTCSWLCRARLRHFLQDKAEHCQQLFAFNSFLLLRGTVTAFRCSWAPCGTSLCPRWAPGTAWLWRGE